MNVPSLFYLCFFSLLIGCASKKEDSTNNAKNSAKEEVTDTEKKLRTDIQDHPDSLVLFENLIQYYRDKDQYPEALKEIDRTLAINKNQPRLWEMRGTLLFEQEDTLGAIHSFEQVIKTDASPKYRVSLGILYAQTANPKALELADSLLSYPQTDLAKDAYFIKGFYHNFKNEPQKAIPYFNRCLAASYTYMDAYREKSIALYNLGKYTDALQVLDKAITLQNNYDEAYYYSGKCLEKLNREEEAIQSYKNALFIDPNYREAQNALQKLEKR